MRIIYLIPIIIILFIFSNNVSAENHDDVTTDMSNEDNSTKKTHELFNYQINIYGIIIAAVLTVLVPIIYHTRQIYRKRKAVIEIWRIRIDVAEDIKINPTNTGEEELRHLIFELEKLEVLVADSFSEVDYIRYVGRIRWLNQLINSTARRVYIRNFVIDLLRQLIRT